jgi:hypothetical protein
MLENALRKLQKEIENLQMINGANEMIASVNDALGSGYGMGINFVSLDFFYGQGANWKPTGAVLIFKGDDAGKVLWLTDAGGGMGYSDVSASFTEVNFYYNGNIDNFGVETFRLARYEINAGYGKSGISAAFNYSISTTDMYGGEVQGYGISIGVGIPGASWNINFGTSNIFNY